MNDLTDEQRARALELYRLDYYLRTGREAAVTDFSEAPEIVKVWLAVEAHILQSHECKMVWRPTTCDEIQAGWEIRSRRYDGKEATWGVAHHQDEDGDWCTASGVMLTLDSMDRTYETTNTMNRPPAEEALITRLRKILGKNLNQSDIDFLHLLTHPDVIEFTFDYLAGK